MSLFAATRGMWLPTILHRQLPGDTDLREWLLSGSWMLASLSTRKVQLEIFDLRNVDGHLAGDFVKFATAAFESAVSVRSQPDRPCMCAWQIISTYYSAYFAANAIMRLHGYICTNLDYKVCSEINEIAQLSALTGFDHKKGLQSGTFYGRVERTGTPALSLTSLSGVSGGVHSQFWAAFLRFADDLAAEVKRSSIAAAQRDSATKQLDLLRTALTRDGNATGAWLSQLRNRINYRFDENVWYPHGGGLESEELRRAVSECVSGASSIPPSSTVMAEAERLMRVVGFLLGWIKLVLELIAKNLNEKSRRKLDDGALSFARQI